MDRLVKMELLWIVIFAYLFIHPTQGQSCLPFSSHFSGFLGGRCCDGEFFTYENLVNFFIPCSVAPSDPNLSFPSCHWIFLECVIRKSLESPPRKNSLNLLTFSEKMSQYMVPARQELIQKLLSREYKEEILIESDASTDDKVTLMRSLWDKYFEAEYRVNVCSNVSKANFNATTSRRWVPEHRCEGTQSYPDIPHLHATKYQVQYWENDLRTTCDLTGFITREQVNSLRKACAVLQSGFLTLENLFNEINYEQNIDRLLPGYWSQSVKDLIKKSLGKSVRKVLNVAETDSLSDVIGKIKKKSEERLAELESHNATESFYVNIFMLDYLVEGIARSRVHVCSDG